jgi:hypothetical protein
MFAIVPYGPCVHKTGAGRGFFVNVTAGRAVYKNAERPEASGWGVATLLREIIAKDVKARGGRGRDLTRRMLYLPALIVAAVLMACAVVVLVVSEKAKATFPGKNGRIAFVSTRDTKTESGDIYTMNPNGTGLERLTNNRVADFNPDWQPLSPPDNWPFKVKGSA